MKKHDYIILSIILVIAFTLRLYKINDPLADLHSQKQAAVASVGKNFATNGFNLLQPKSNDISNMQSGNDNPQGYYFAEFPIYSAIFGFFYRYLPITSLEVYARLTSILFTLPIIGIIYYFGLKEHSRVAGVVGAILYGILPFFVYFSRIVIPETAALSFMFISLWLLYLYLKNTEHNLLLFFLSIVMYSLSIVIKPTTIFYTIAAGFLFLSHYKFDVFKKWQLYIFPIVGLAPFVFWNIYLQQYPEGIPLNEKLFQYGTNIENLQNIFFSTAYFRTIIVDRFGISILGIFLTGFLLLGTVANVKKYFLLSILASATFYLLAIQAANFQYEYYQIIALPAIAIMTGLGIAQILTARTVFNPFLAYPVIIVTILVSFVVSYDRVKKYYEYPQDTVQIAKLITTFTQEDDLIVTDMDGDSTILYLADRKGSPGRNKTIQQFKEQGYSYFVTNKKNVTEELKEEGYTILVDNDRISIIKL